MTDDRIEGLPDDVAQFLAQVIDVVRINDNHEETVVRKLRFTITEYPEGSTYIELERPVRACRAILDARKRGRGGNEADRPAMDQNPERAV